MTTGAKEAGRTSPVGRLTESTVRMRPAERVTRPEAALLVAAALAGIALRFWVMHLPLRVLDSDEAVVGLMARHLVHGREFPVMYWGQGYGGTIEPMVSAALFAVFGSSVLALKATSLILSAVATLLLVPVGTRLVGARAARLGAAAFWVSTANYIVWSTKARGFYWALMILGLLVVLVATRLADHPERRRDWVALGLLAGLGWWTNPQIVYFLVPTILWLVWRLRGDALRGVVAVPAFLVGATPWLVWNLQHGWLSLKPASQPVPFSPPKNLWRFFVEGVPVSIGFVSTRGWVFPALKGLYIAVMVAAVVGAVRSGRRYLYVLAVLATYPFLFAMFPQSWAVGEGRYILFFAPFLWLLIATAARRLPIAAAGLGAVVALTVYGMTVLDATVVQLAPDVPIPERTAPLIRDLERHHDTRVWANYWVAYRISFESGERIIATPLPGEQTRYQPFAEQVSASPQPTRVFVLGSFTETDFTLRASGAPGCWDRSLVGGFTVYRRAAQAPLPPDQCEAATA